MRVFVFLHVFTMFAGVALGYGLMAWLWLAARSRDLVAIRGMTSVVGRYPQLIGGGFTLGVVLGGVAIFTNGFDPLAPWLVIAYVLAVGLVLSGSLMIGPWVKRLGEVVATTEGDTADPLPAPFTDGRSRVLLSLDLLMLVAIIFDMIVKPFS